MEDQQQLTYEQRLRAVLDVVRRYLPPDGITPGEAMGEIVQLVDPWPASPSSSVLERARDALAYAQLALDTAVAGLEWYRDRCPDAVDGSDDEADEEIGGALEAVRSALAEIDRALGGGR